MCNKELVRNKIEEYYQIAEQAYDRAFSRPSISFTKRGTSAGWANSHHNALNFNNVLLNENLDKFLISTVPHEVAHLIDHAVYDSHAVKFDRLGRRKKRSIHGRTWKSVMTTLGANPNRCHTYDALNVAGSASQSASVNYYCTGCDQTFQMGTTRHKRMITGQKTYVHCRGFKLIQVK